MSRRPAPPVPLRRGSVVRCWFMVWIADCGSRIADWGRSSRPLRDHSWPPAGRAFAARWGRIGFSCRCVSVTTASLAAADPGGGGASKKIRLLPQIRHVGRQRARRRLRHNFITRRSRKFGRHHQGAGRGRPPDFTNVKQIPVGRHEGMGGVQSLIMRASQSRVRTAMATIRNPALARSGPTLCAPSITVWSNM